MNAETLPTGTPQTWVQPLATLASRPLRFLNETLLR